MPNTPAPEPGSFAWLRARMSNDVIRSQGLVRYPQNEVDLIVGAFTDHDEGQTKWALGRAEKSAGLLMPKHAVPGERPIPPQLRPDVPPVKRMPAHYHAWAHPGAYVPVDPTTGKPIPEKRCLSAWEARWHILGVRRHHPEAWEAAARRGYDTPKKVLRLLADADDDKRLRADLVAILKEADCSEPHYTFREGKYQITVRRRKEWVHDHAEYATARGLKLHLERHHCGSDDTGGFEHGHVDKHGNPVTIWDDSDEFSPGRRINFNPGAWELLPAANYVFFCIEGTIKSCAMLSQIIERRLPATVFDVPSVGQWEAAELVRLLPLLRDKAIVVVPDADGAEKWQVLNQATLCARWFRDRGFAAVIAAPPLAPDGTVSHKGVDDYIANDGWLLDMEIVGFEIDYFAYSHLRERLAKGRVHVGRWQDGVDSDWRVMEGLALLGGELGIVSCSTEKLAKFTGLSRHAVSAALERLNRLGLISGEGSTRVGHWNRYTKKYEEDEWMERPKFVIRERDLRAVRSDLRRVREWDEIKTPHRENTTMQLQPQDVSALASLFATHDVRLSIDIRPKDTEEALNRDEELAAAIDTWGETK